MKNNGYLTKEDLMNVQRQTNAVVILERTFGKKLALRIIAEMLSYKESEEGIGCPSFIAFRALKEGFWHREGKYMLRYIDHDRVTISWQIEDNESEAASDDVTWVHKERLVLCDEFKLEDFGKTWAFDKEDLE